MIWHNSEHKVEGWEFYIIGTYINNEVKIILMCDNKGTMLEHVIFEKLISSMRQEDPTTDDLENKFGNKITKFVKNASGTTILRIFKLLPESE